MASKEGALSAGAGDFAEHAGLDVAGLTPPGEMNVADGWHGRVASRAGRHGGEVYHARQVFESARGLPFVAASMIRMGTRKP